MSIHKYKHIHIYMYVCVCMCVYVCVCIGVCVFVYIYICVYMYIIIILCNYTSLNLFKNLFKPNYVILTPIYVTFIIVNKKCSNISTFSGFSRDYCFPEKFEVNCSLRSFKQNTQVKCTT